MRSSWCANCPMAASGWSRSPSRWRRSPRVLLLDEPAAGVPSSESHLILDVVASLDPDIAILIIEHDMDVVFRFAQGDHGAGAGRGVHARHARRDHGQRGGARGLSRPGRPARCAMVERALELDKVCAGYGETVVLEDVDLTLDAGETVSIIGRNGVGKIDAACDHHGPHDTARRRDPPARQGHRRTRNLPARRRRPRSGAAGARNLSLAQRAWKISRSRRGRGHGR